MLNNIDNFQVLHSVANFVPLNSNLQAWECFIYPFNGFQPKGMQLVWK